jgi:hypothetical protein
VTAGWGPRAIRKQDTHRCPRRGCSVQVPDRVFSCRPDWFKLSAPVRAAIQATASKNLLDPERRAAIDAAREEWAGA